ncbi:hypothetical protein V3851_00360 [Paenibacillus sp. M1]|uniref:Permuted papain-like amidase YaeF/Yiix C92 family enzyme n=1 Tax=Paenibacillus haidiansis TaxID=1574488 RepID=A0ABU7VKL9_9BACL
MKTKQIYIMLSNPNTVVAKMIGLYTRAPYNHASIAFDPELSEMYSFGRKHPLLPMFGGFVKENIHSRVFERATCALYSYSVDEGTYNEMRAYVRRFEENRDLYSYNYLGLLGVILNTELGGENSYFCSQFVSSVFQECGVKLLDKSAGLTTPDDFSTSSLLKLTFRGEMEIYRRKYCRPSDALPEQHMYATN